MRLPEYMKIYSFLLKAFGIYATIPLYFLKKRRSMKRFFQPILLLVLLLLCGCSQVSPYPDWVSTDEGQRYYSEEDTYATGWTTIEGKAYYFDRDGWLQTGWLQLEDKLYFTDETGAVQSGWVTLDGGTYYFDPLQNHAAATGWLQLEGKQYHFGTDGILSCGWVTIDNAMHWFDQDGLPGNGWMKQKEGTYYLSSNGKAQTGWLELEGERYYFDDAGHMQTGWVTLEDGRYYLTSKGTATRGFVMLNNQSYYFDQNGRMATGKQVIDGQTCYFEESGAQILLVNSWNYLPDHYTTELGITQNGLKVSVVCQDALAEMLKGLRQAGHAVRIKSANRTTGDQRYLHNNKVQQYINMGYSQEEAKAIAATIVAIPGTSEHQLGLAVDLADVNYLTLNRHQETMPAQKWLMEHCWEYGFILRYPNEKSEITGIIYEPWHYRYVGKELALKIRDSGLCLEEYLETMF